MADGLQRLFGSPARIKLLRLFLFNPRMSFTVVDAAKRARISDDEARKEFRVLSGAGLIARAARGKGVRYGLDADFEYIAALQNLLINAPARAKDIIERIRPAGTFKLVILSGMFVGDWDGSIDALLVGDRVKDKKLRERIRSFEAELGKEIRYSLLSTNDFFYRLNLNDKLIRDVLDYPHTIVLDRLDIGLK